MSCQIKDELTREYLAAMEELNLVQGSPSSDAWRNATGQLRSTCGELLAALNAHRREHGC